MPTRALIVDDDPHFRVLIEHVLGDRGIETLQAASAEEAYGIACDERPDVIVLDWRLPGESGPQLCRRLRAHGAFATTPVIILTGLSDPRDRELALDAGANAMITKDSAVDLAEVVLRVSEGRPAG